MAYGHLVTHTFAYNLVPGDTFVSNDWQYAYIVVDVTKFGFTPEAGKVYCWSLVEDHAIMLDSQDLVKKQEMYHYTFED